MGIKLTDELGNKWVSVPTSQLVKLPPDTIAVKLVTPPQKKGKQT